MSVTVNLNKTELFVLTSALQYLTRNEEMKLQKEYGELAPLYNKLYSLMCEETAGKVAHHTDQQGNGAPIITR